MRRVIHSTARFTTMPVTTTVISTKMPMTMRWVSITSSMRHCTATTMPKTT